MKISDFNLGKVMPKACNIYFISFFSYITRSILSNPFCKRLPKTGYNSTHKLYTLHLIPLMLITLQNERKYLHQSFFQQQITHILHHHLHLKLLSFLARVYQVLVTNDGILS